MIIVALSVMFAANASAAKRPPIRSYLVLAETNATPAAVRAAVVKARGRIVNVNRAIGLYTAESRDTRFASVATATRAIASVGRVRPLTQLSPATRRKKFDPDIIGQGLASAWRDEPKHSRGGEKRRKRTGEPLAFFQWDMEMIGATPVSRRKQYGGKREVLVGVIDTGIDASHPDLAPNVNLPLSRNFTVDIPVIDGPCAEDPDGLCTDPADVDEDGHGTHVAGTIAAASNRLGIAGVAPKVSLVNLRAGSDSGYFFLKPTLDAITYAGDAGIDVVNMSFYTDPWLFNCRNNPADTRAQRAEQALVIDATQRAVNYARARGVTLVAALGNDSIDLGNPTVDDSSPDFPPGIARRRLIDNSCVNVPTETAGVISVASVGPTGGKPWYSNYGLEQTDIAAPGGDSASPPGTFESPVATNAVLSAYPMALAYARREVANDGTPLGGRVVRDCKGDLCGYYRWEEGTSMAAPHAAGVAALIISERGRRVPAGGITLDPAITERLLLASATKTSCPTPALIDYGVFGRGLAGLTAQCDGDLNRNGFTGGGVVNARAAVTAARAERRESAAPVDPEVEHGDEQ